MIRGGHRDEGTTRAWLAVWLPMTLLCAACASTPPPKTPELAADPPLDEHGQVASGATTTELERAVAYIKNEKWDDAKQHLAQVLAARPDDPEANYYLGVADEKLGDRDGAAAAYKKALAKDPSFAEAATNLAAMLLDPPPKPDEAIEVMKGVLAKKPDDVPLLRNLAYAYGLKGDVANASKYYDEALAKGDDAQIRLAYAQLLVDAKQPDKAVPHLKKALEATGDDGPLLATIGTLLGYTKSYADCVSAFDRALKTKADQPEWLTRRGTCRHGLKDDAGAKADFEAAVKADPSYAPAHFYLGQALILDKKRNTALDELKKAKELGKGGPISKAADEAIAELTTGKHK